MRLSHLLRLIAALALPAATLAGCHADPSGLGEPDSEAVSAATRFTELADSLATTGADRRLSDSYRAIASMLRLHSRTTGVRLSVDGVEADWLASAREVGLPAPVCPRNAVCDPTPGNLNIVGIVAWQRADLRRVVQLTSLGDARRIGDSPFGFGVGGPFQQAPTLTYLDGVGGVFAAQTGDQSVRVTHTDWRCASSPDLTSAALVPVPTICTVAGMHASFAATVQPVRTFSLAANTATGSHTVSMTPQDVEGARVEMQRCDQCYLIGYPVSLLPPINMSGTQVLPATLRVTVDSLVTFRLDVVNVTGAPQVLHFNDAQQYDFVIRTPQGAAVWQWSADRSFAAALSSRTLAAGEHLAMTESWRPTSRGAFVVLGRLTSSTHFAEATSSFVVP